MAGPPTSRSESTAPRADALSEREQRLLRMLLWDLWGRRLPDGLQAAADQFWEYGAVRDELRQLLEVLDARSTTLARPTDLAPEIPLALHARYSSAAVIAALRSEATAPATPLVPQTGVVWEKHAGVDVFFVSLRKSDRDYSPTTMYRDYAISRELFHWESQTIQHTGLDTVQRYINHRERGTRVLLFVREAKNDELATTTPFMFLGPVEYVSHESERPVRFTWRLPTPMPEELFEVARSVAAA